MIQDVPVYEKSITELCLNKKNKNEDLKTIQVIGQLVDIMLGRISFPKYVDLGIPIIKVCIGEFIIPNALVNLGAEINIMINETREKMDLQGLRPSPIVL